MRFKEFFVETPAADAPPPDWHLSSPAVPGQAASSPQPQLTSVSDTPKPGYKAMIITMNDNPKDKRIIWVPKNSSSDQISASLEANPAVLKTAQPDLSRTNIASNASPDLAQAKSVADRYLGRPLADYEWDSLLRVSYAEAAHNAEEQAWVMASVLNSVRMYKNTVYHEISKTNRMQSVTGPKGNRVASPNFSNAINQQGLDEVLAAVKILPTVPKSIVHFTAADEKAYQQGTNTGWKVKLMTIYQGTKAKVNPPNIWGKIVGKSVFSTDFTNEDFLDIRTKLAAKATATKPASKFIPKTPVKPVAKTVPAPKAPAAKPQVAPKVGKKL